MYCDSCWNDRPKLFQVFRMSGEERKFMQHEGGEEHSLRKT